MRVKSSTYPILRLFNGVCGGGQGESKVKHIPNFTCLMEFVEEGKVRVKSSTHKHLHLFFPEG